MPCRQREVQEEVGGTAFGQEYDRIFRDPELGTETYRNCWLSAKLALAGPLYGTRITGSIEWLFRGEERLPGVQDPESLLDWCHEVIRRLRSCVKERGAASSRDDRDRQALEAKAVELEQLVRVWHEFYLARHARAPG
jgi:hypothetical protein